MSRVGGGGGGASADRTEKSSASSSALGSQPRAGARKKRGRPKIPKSWSAAAAGGRKRGNGGGGTGRRKAKKPRDDRPLPPPPDDSAYGETADGARSDASSAPAVVKSPAASSGPQLVAPQHSSRRARLSLSVATVESLSAASSSPPLDSLSFATKAVPPLLPSTVAERANVEPPVAANDSLRSDRSSSNRGAPLSSDAATTAEEGVATGDGDRPVLASNPATTALIARSHPKPTRPRTASLASRILSAVKSVLVATVAAATSVENGGGGSAGGGGGASELKVETNVDAKRAFGADTERESERTARSLTSPSHTFGDLGRTQSTASPSLPAARQKPSVPPPPPPSLQSLVSLPPPSSDSLSDSYPISTDLDEFLADLVGPPPSCPSTAATPRNPAPLESVVVPSTPPRPASAEPLDANSGVAIPSPSFPSSVSSSAAVAPTDASQDGAAGGDHFGTYDETRRLEFHTKCRGCARRDRSGELLCRDCGMGRCPRCGTLWDHHGQCTFCVALVDRSRLTP